jgi:hypothetical protein
LLAADVGVCRASNTTSARRKTRPAALLPIALQLWAAVDTVPYLLPVVARLGAVGSWHGRFIGPCPKVKWLGAHVASKARNGLHMRASGVRNRMLVSLRGEGVN